MAEYYDESFFYARAGRLYQEARDIQLRTAMKAAAHGIILGVVIIATISIILKLNNLENVFSSPENDSVILVAILGVIGAWIGWGRGREKADLLRYQAQEILWKVRVENNTRKCGVQSGQCTLPDDNNIKCPAPSMSGEAPAEK